MAKQQESEFFSDAEDFFASDQPVRKTVSCPEMKPGPNGEVRKVIVQNMSGPEKVSLDARRWDPTKQGGDPERFRAKWFEEDRPFELVAACCIRPDGTRLFTADAVKRMKGLNPKTFARLLAAAQEVNGEDAADLKLSGKAESYSLNGVNGNGSLIATVTEA